MNLLRLVFCALMVSNVNALPTQFVYLHQLSPAIIEDLRYAGSNNFIGRPIQGYLSNKCILTREAALALSRVEKRLKAYHLGLKVYDCYRPQIAVEQFATWSMNPKDNRMKKTYYPHIKKSELFSLGYLAARSGHSRGSTVDLTLVDALGRELNMGTSFDYLDPASNADSLLVSQLAIANRQILRTVMIDAGFIPMSTEWWHFTLNNEPFPNDYFNFAVS